MSTQTLQRVTSFKDLLDPACLASLDFTRVKVGGRWLIHRNEDPDECFEVVILDPPRPVALRSLTVEHLVGGWFRKVEHRMVFTDNQIPGPLFRRAGSRNTTHTGEATS